MPSQGGTVASGCRRNPLEAFIGNLNTKPSSPPITLGFSIHRAEVLDFAAQAMARHDLILLEEPPTPGFDKMLHRELGVGEYVMGTDTEFPEFTIRSCRIYQDLWEKGKQFFQVEPYLETLMGIHEHLADGGRPSDFRQGSLQWRVYQMERRATRSLLAYYQSVMQDPFEGVVEAVKTFARDDAARLMLRDRLRERAIRTVIPPEHSAYVECGYIHFPLLYYLLRQRSVRGRIKPLYLTESVVRSLCGKRIVWGPGDRLTLLYAFHPAYSRADADLLAARSLIYIKLLEKDEQIDDEGPYPHTRNEIAALDAVTGLDFDECGRLFQEIRFKRSDAARTHVTTHLEMRDGMPPVITPPEGMH